jgi:hypothetical protein
MKMAVMKLGNTPRPVAWSPLASFIPSTGVDPCNKLIQLSPSSYGGGFLVNGVGRMVGSGSRRRRKLLIDRGGAMSTEEGLCQRGPRTEAKRAWVDPIGRLAQPVFGPVRARLSPHDSSSHFALGPLHLGHFEVVIPAIKIGGFSHEVRTLRLSPRG